MASRTRLFKEYKELQRDIQKGAAADADINLVPDESDIYRWTAFIKGPEGTPYVGMTYEVSLHVPEQYPMVPPSAKFRTKIFHPNVHFKTGEICLDILKSAWTPAWTLQSVCRAITALMGCPEPDSPLNCDCGNLLRAGDYRAYKSVARMYTQLAQQQQQSRRSR